MKVIILAAGQGTRLRPFTNDKPKCMVEINQQSMIKRQLKVMMECGVKTQDIYVLCGYKEDVLKKYLDGMGINFITNTEYMDTNMVYTLMCAKNVMEAEDEIIISYGDIVYKREVFQTILNEQKDISVIVDEGWYAYWSQRCENPLDDAETLVMDDEQNLIEIGQKTTELSKVQAQYIGLMKFKNDGIQKMLKLCEKAKQYSAEGKTLWRTARTYHKMYMTDLLQGLIDEGNKLKAVQINRGWFEVDCYEDLKIAEKQIETWKTEF